MATFASPSQPLASPKRKRESESNDARSRFSDPVPKLATDLPTQPDVDEKETGSPRSVVAGHLQQLDLEDPWVRQLSFKDAGRARKRIAFMNTEPEGPLDHHTDRAIGMEGQPTLHRDYYSENPPNNVGPVPFTIEGHETSDSNILSKPRARSKSPSMDSDSGDNPLIWHDSEITGHDPKDPEDDGYGINGVGFRPTPAMAWSRSQKRRLQIEGYKSREAKEARQRRSARRKHVSVESAELPATEANNGSKVRFMDSEMD